MFDIVDVRSLDKAFHAILSRMAENGHVPHRSGVMPFVGLAN